MRASSGASATLTALFITFCVSTASAQAPPGYYNSVDTSNATTLRNTLHAVIDDHTRYPYTAGQDDTWDILEMAQEDAGNSNNIIDLYLNESYPKQGGGNSLYNREHTWPSSYGFPNDLVGNYPFTDCHLLHLSNDSYNSSRSNKPYRNCSPGCDEEPTEVTAGQGGGTGTYPGNSNWTTGAFTSGTWETWIGRRGDVARALLYADVRYEGGTHGGTFDSEPNLILTDNENLIDNSNTGSNISVAYMGMLSVLLEWHAEDPVDAKEMSKNDVVFSFQGNRNPFIDHPEWVNCLFSGNCSGDVTPPAAPLGLGASAGNGLVNLDWLNNAEPDLDGYNVYRSLVPGGPYAQVNGALVLTSDYTDTGAGVMNGVTYHYVVAAVDTSANESTDSAEDSATPMGPPVLPVPTFINELHYDNNGADVGEGIEIAGQAGTNLSGWSVEFYNGTTGQVYSTIALSGVIPDEQNCMGTLGFFEPDIQNSFEAVALVDDTNTAVQFLSYEGTVFAIGGAANGLTSVDIGVAESSSTPVGSSLQLVGNGDDYTDFIWQPPSPDSPGVKNFGQVFVNTCAPPTATNYCMTAPNSAGSGSLISSTGTTSIANNDFALVAVGAAPNQFGLFYYGGGQIQAPFGDGFRCVGAGAQGTYRINPAQSSDGAGMFTRAFNFTAPPFDAGGGAVTAGSSWNFQYWFRDPAGPGGAGFNLSDGLNAVFQP